MRVRFPVQQPLAKIHQIYLNERLICSEARGDHQRKFSERWRNHKFFYHISESASFITTLTLLFTYTTNLPAEPIYRPQPTMPTYQPPQTIPTTSISPQMTHYYQPNTDTVHTTTTYPTYTIRTTEISTIYNPGLIEENCGVSSIKAEEDVTGLINGGQKVVRGQLPWLVAYFYNNKYNTDFICGGSLISQRLVITAAHCVQNKNDAEVRKPELSTFYIGKNNLDALVGENGYVVSNAVYLLVHPNWNSGEVLFTNDIAIAVLQNTIQFTIFVKPICIWRKTRTYRDVIGRNGFIAGWGKSEFESISSSSPMYVELPIVSNEDCLRSEMRLSKIVSKQSFCAGIKDSKKGPCNGDSG